MLGTMHSLLKVEARQQCNFIWVHLSLTLSPPYLSLKSEWDKLAAEGRPAVCGAVASGENGLKYPTCEDECEVCFLSRHQQRKFSTSLAHSAT